MDDKLATGVIRTSFGLKGFLKVKVYSGNYEHFKTLKEVTLKKKNQTLVVRIEKIEIIGGVLMVKFEGYDSPEKARLLNGFEIFIDRTQAAALKPGEHYASDLVNLDVMFDGKKVGKTVSFVDNSTTILLEITTEEDDYFIPYEKKFFENLNLEKGCIDIKEPELIS